MKNILDDYIENYRIQRLFRAVLLVAAKDAFLNKSRKRKKLKLQKEALDFFKENDDLKCVCKMGGVEYQNVVLVAGDENLKKREKYKKIILTILEKY